MMDFTPRRGFGRPATIWTCRPFGITLATLFFGVVMDSMLFGQITWHLQFSAWGPSNPAQDRPEPASATQPPQESRSTLPDLPQALTSFGAAVTSEAIFVYGGHLGDAHDYSQDAQSDQLLRLDRRDPLQWEIVSRGPRLQGLALVAHKDKLYRLGGFTARNAPGEEHDLWSQDTVSCFDPSTGQWQPLTSLPEPRSSLDAAVVGDRVYVVGGWTLRGKEQQWLATAWSLDLNQPNAKWEAVPQPFERRAVAAASHQGQLFVIGGMQHTGGPTTRVDRFDPATGEWHRCPDLVGSPATGFGCSAYSLDGKLLVTTPEGDLQQLADDGASWKVLQPLSTQRLFHRLVPLRSDTLLMIGGVNMKEGKYGHLESIVLKPISAGRL
jgi:N-acetylneuraminic acid mutarotase